MALQHKAHRDFHYIWDRTNDKNSPEVGEARNRFIAANDLLWSTLLGPLQNKFHNDPISAIDEIVDFLEADVPAFRCGYLKEYFLQHLKSQPLSEQQKERLRTIALKLCSSNMVRREFRRWAHLMTQIADTDFVLDLKKLAEKQAPHKRRGTSLMLKSVLDQRKDLYSTIASE